MPVATPRRSVFGGVLLVLFVVLVAAMLGGCTSGTKTPPGPSLTAAATTPSDADLTAEAVGDGTYLNGYDYLRGVNSYTLQFDVGETDLADVGEPQASYDFLAAHGSRIIRLAVPWRDLQPVPSNGDVQAGLDGPVRSEYLAAVTAEIGKIAHAGMRTILDLHNGCTYPWGPGAFVDGSVRCGDGISIAQATGVWLALSDAFRADARVAAYDIFNEPRFSVGIDVYKQYSQAVVDALRNNGDEHMLWVEAVLGDRGRLATMAPDGPWIVDPLQKVMYSEHFYATEAGDAFDDSADYSPVLDSLDTFVDWCRVGGVRCSVGEVGWPSGGPGGAQSALSASSWNDFFEAFYAIADAAALDVTYFGASSVQSGPLLAYGSTDPASPAPGIDHAFSQAEVVEEHPSEPVRQ